MKIEWLNDEMTKALVTVGVIRQRQAVLYRDSDYGNAYWSFSANRAATGWWLSSRIERRRRKARSTNPWQPVRRLPEARLVQRLP